MASAMVQFNVEFKVHSSTRYLSQPDDSSGRISLSTQFLRTCRQIYDEAAVYLYGMNTFLIAEQDTSSFESLIISSSIRLCVNKLHIRIPRLGQQPDYNAISKAFPSVSILSVFAPGPGPSLLLAAFALSQILVNSHICDSEPRLELHARIPANKKTIQASAQALKNPTHYSLPADKSRQLYKLFKSPSSFKMASLDVFTKPLLRLGQQISGFAAIQIHGELHPDYVHAIEQHECNYGDCGFEKAKETPMVDDGLKEVVYVWKQKGGQAAAIRAWLKTNVVSVPSKEAQFEKIISQLAGGKRTHDTPILRQFHMPSHIFTSANTVLEKKESISGLESLHPTVILYILNFLEGNDQIMLALSCKTLASLVEASPIGKIANLTVYSRWPCMPGFLKAKGEGSTDAQYLRKGYGRPLDYDWYDEQCAARRQCIQLKDRVAKYLGPKHGWCQECKLFRLTDASWWRELAEHENPGILEEQHAVDKLDAAINMWLGHGSFMNLVLDAPSCPVHTLLEEDEHGPDTLYLSYKRHRLIDIFIITGAYVLTGLIAIFLYSSRLYTNRSVLRDIPKTFLPIDKDDLPNRRVWVLIQDRLARAAVAAYHATPRARRIEVEHPIAGERILLVTKQHQAYDHPEQSRLTDDEKKLLEPKWGKVQHPGWRSPAATDMPGLEYIDVVNQLADLVEANAVSLSSLAEDDAPAAARATLANDDEEKDKKKKGVIDLVTRPEHLGMRQYLVWLIRLGVVPDNTATESFIRAYERARFAAQPLSTSEFDDLMRCFAELLRSMKPLEPEDSAAPSMSEDEDNGDSNDNPSLTTTAAAATS
ncbi:hypothetical protein DV737_g1961, partial [Chaetothyriales sp. CBS 132003]